MKQVDGAFVLVLHAHLPFVRHPENPFHLEEQWLYQAIVDSYLPLLERLRAWEDEGLRYRVTLSLSPSLLAMLEDPLLKTRGAAHLDRLDALAEKEVRRTRGGELALYYAARYRRLHALYDQIDGDLVAAFAALDRKGQLELIAVAGSHAFLPLVAHPVCRQAQIEVGVQAFERSIGRAPRGMWLPECGFVPDLDNDLRAAGVEYFFVDSHSLVMAEPPPPYGVYTPILCASGVAAFARDPDASKQVWSQAEGYPGDACYREFYRDIGFDLSAEELAPMAHPDGIRLDTGFKYFRISGPKVDLGEKRPYQPNLALARAREHARDFVMSRAAQARALAAEMDRMPLLVAPYDAELFGHWWFEGPEFLDAVVRECNRPDCSVEMWTASDYLEKFAIQPVANPHPCSWGEGGYSQVWLNSSNQWIYPHLHWAEAEMVALATGLVEPSEIEQRAVNQAARELFLAQSSDWAFMMGCNTAVDYACDRVKLHLRRFRCLSESLRAAQIDHTWLAAVEAEDNLFSWIDYNWFTQRTAPTQAARLAADEKMADELLCRSTIRP